MADGSLKATGNDARPVRWLVMDIELKLFFYSICTPT